MDGDNEDRRLTNIHECVCISGSGRACHVELSNNTIGDKEIRSLKTDDRRRVQCKALPGIHTGKERK